MSAPDLIHPVIGFRSFLVDEDTWLRSINGRFGIWRRGMNTAKCNADEIGDRHLRAYFADIRNPEPPHGHKAPHEHCQCGLYAFHKPRHAGGQILAAIRAEGRIAVHNDGFRAERAEVIAIARLPSCELPESRLEYIASVYGAEACSLQDLERVALRYGMPVPKEMFPQDPEAKKDEPLVPETMAPILKSAWNPSIFASIDPGPETKKLEKKARFRERFSFAVNGAAAAVNGAFYVFVGHHWYSLLVAGVTAGLFGSQLMQAMTKH